MGLPQGSFFLDDTAGPPAPQRAVCSRSIYHYLAKLRSRGVIEKERPLMLDSRRRRSPRIYRTDPYYGREERGGARFATCELLIFGRSPLFLSRGDALLRDHSCRVPSSIYRSVTVVFPAHALASARSTMRVACLYRTVFLMFPSVLRSVSVRCVVCFRVSLCLLSALALALALARALPLSLRSALHVTHHVSSRQQYAQPQQQYQYAAQVSRQ